MTLRDLVFHTGSHRGGGAASRNVMAHPAYPFSPQSGCSAFNHPWPPKVRRRPCKGGFGDAEATDLYPSCKHTSSQIASDMPRTEVAILRQLHSESVKSRRADRTVATAETKVLDAYDLGTVL